MGLGHGVSLGDRMMMMMMMMLMMMMMMLMMMIPGPVLSDPNCAVLSDPNPVVPSDPATMSNHQEKQLRWVMAQNSWNEYRNVIDQCQLN